MSSTGIITQARTGSTRLPEKVLKTVGGRTLLEIHLDRLRKLDVPLVVATTTHPRDDRIVELLESRGVNFWRGDEEDVLNRYAEAAEFYDLSTVVRVTSDCPLIDAELIDRGLRRFHQRELDFLDASYTESRNLPHGMNFQIFSRDKIMEADRDARSDYEREHVVPYLQNDDALNSSDFDVDQDYGWIRITVDYPEDFTLVAHLVEEYQADRLGWKEIARLFDQHPELLDLNRNRNEHLDGSSDPEGE